jgi:hypothetical protein
LIKDADFQPVIQNMVATPNFEQPINHEDLSQTRRPIYEPEQFPEAILRLPSHLRHAFKYLPQEKGNNRTKKRQTDKTSYPKK